jgi:hypothetical protein
LLPAVPSSRQFQLLFGTAAAAMLVIAWAMAFGVWA